MEINHVIRNNSDASEGISAERFPESRGCEGTEEGKAEGQNLTTLSTSPTHTPHTLVHNAAHIQCPPAGCPVLPTYWVPCE